MKKPISHALVKRKFFIALLFIVHISTNPSWAQVIPPVPNPEKAGCFSSTGAFQPCGSSWTDSYNGVPYNCFCDCSSLSAQDCVPTSGPNNANSGQGSLPGQFNPGDVSINGILEGKPFFTSHPSQAFEDWASEYKQLLASYGITSILGKNFTIPRTPLTDDKYFNAAYTNLSAKFEPTTKPVRNPKTEPASDSNTGFSGKTVPLMGSAPLTQAERERQILVNKFGQQYIDGMTYIRPESGIVESTTPTTDLSDSKEYKMAEAFFDKIGDTKLGVLPAYTGKLMLSTVNETDKLIRDITINGKYSAEELTAMNPVKVIFNNVTVEQVSSKVGDVLGNVTEKSGVAYLGKKYGEAGKTGAELGMKLGKDSKNLMEIWTAKRH